MNDPDGPDHDGDPGKGLLIAAVLGVGCLVVLRIMLSWVLGR